LFQAWGEIDRSHRKLAHRGSRLDLVHVSESTVLRVLAAEGIALPGNPRRDPIPRTPWPDWLEWKPNHIWADDFTHFTRARRAAIAILDMVSRKWLTTLVAAEESSTQVEVAFTAALDAEGSDPCADNASYMITNLPTQYSHPWPLPAWLRAVMMSLQLRGQTLLTVIAKSDHGGQRVTVSHRVRVSGCSNPGFTSPASSHAAVVETPPTGDGQRAGEDHEHSPPSLRAQSLRLRGLSSAAGQTDGSDACRRPRNPRATAGECRAVPGSHMDLRSRWMFENHTQADPFLRLRDRER